MKCTCEPIDLEPTGTVIAAGAIEGRAVPWKAPTVTRYGTPGKSTRGYKSYKSWQEIVHYLAAQYRRHRRPYGGPVRLDVRFVLHPRPGTKPDRSNLLKAFEDAIQGVLIHDDTQICSGHTERTVTSQEPERVEFRITAI